MWVHRRGQGNVPSILGGTGSKNGCFGKPVRTLVFAERYTQEAILRAIRGGRCVAYVYGTFYGPPDLVLIAQILLEEGAYLAAQHGKRFKERLAALP